MYGYGQIAEIRYSDDYAKIIKNIEKIINEKIYNEESLNSTTIAIRANPINYNFWIIRREILKNIKYDPYRELFWMEELIVENPKNFLCWYHRKIIATSNLTCIKMSTELKLTERVLQQDPKNYFAYSHRQWSINTFKFQNLGLLKEEMRFTAALLNDDLRNNSAWNERFFIMNQLGKYDPILVKNELKFALDKIKKVKGNESAWNYLRGLLTSFGTKKLYQSKEIIDFCEEEFYEKKNCTSQLVAFLIELKVEMILDDFLTDNILNCRKVYELCMAMANKYDKLRKNYWKFVYKQFYYDKVMKRKEKRDYVNGGIAEDESWKSQVGKKMDENVFNF